MDLWPCMFFVFIVFGATFKLVVAVACGCCVSNLNFSSQFKIHELQLNW